MRTNSIIAAASVAALLTVAAQAQAQAPRTFVSGHGEDTNPCSLPAPCRSFAQALSQTTAGGEITVLDPAGYGSVTIGKSVSIINDGVGEAGITVNSAAIAAIAINIGAGDVVNLRGLTLVGSGVGENGIVFNNLGALRIQNCVVRGFTSEGIAFAPVGAAALNVSDTVVSDNGTNIAVFPSGTGRVTAEFNRVQAIAGGNSGFLVDGSGSTGTVFATIASSAASNNPTGIEATSATAAAMTQVMVSNSVVSNNGTGVLQEGANSLTFLAKDTISGNATAFIVNNGQLFSFGDNDIAGNSNNAAGTTPSAVASR